VLKEMMPFFNERFGNPSSAHSFGEEARYAVERAREEVAEIIHAKTSNLFFTSSATEANNIFVRCCRGSTLNGWRHIFATNTEHSSIREYLKNIDHQTMVHYLNVDKNGNINPEELDYRLSLEDSLLGIIVSVIAANNEIGTIHNIKRMGEICKKYNVLFHTDATQAIGKIDINVDEMNLFALTMNAHKIYSPKGVGALYVRDIERICPLIMGGYQNTISSGTQNVPAIVGFGKACKILQGEMCSENTRIKGLRDKLLSLLQSELNVTINGTIDNRLQNNLNIAIDSVPADMFVRGMEDVAVSAGSACMSGLIEPSHVIQAIGGNTECSIRISLGRFTTEEEIEYAAKRIIEVAKSYKE
jgi:cysteine desulfurase